MVDAEADAGAGVNGAAATRLSFLLIGSEGEGEGGESGFIAVTLLGGAIDADCCGTGTIWFGIKTRVEWVSSTGNGPGDGRK